MPTNTVHTDYELGFGSSHATPEVEYADHGFGAPFSITISNPFDETEDYIYRNVSETGHGDPYRKTNFFIEGDKTKFSDDGGEVLVIKGLFQNLLPNTPVLKPIGPFQIDFEAVSDGKAYKAYSGVPQIRKLLYTTINQDKMYVCLPVMPKGLYNIKIYYGDGFANFSTITSAIEIIHRNRFDKALAIRANLPAYLDAGERSDNIVAGQDYKSNETNLAVLTKAFAEICDYAFPNAYTVTTGALERGDTTINVETTLRFADSGIIYVGNEKVIYEGKTNTSFTGCSGIRQSLPKNVRVETREGDYAAIPNFILRRHDDLIKPKWALLDQNWDEAFLTMHYGERSAMAVNFQYLYHLFENVSPSSVGSYNSLTRTFSANTVGFVKNVFSQKYCRIADKTYHIESVNESANTMVLTEYGCAYWNKAIKNTKIVGGVETNIPTVLTLEVLPFWVREDDKGLFRIEVETSIFTEDLGFIDKDHIDRNIYLGDDDISDGERSLLRHLASGIKGEVLRRDFFGAKWPLTINQDIRDPLLIIEPTRNLV